MTNHCGWGVSVIFSSLAALGAWGCSDDEADAAGRLELPASVRATSGIRESLRLVIRDQAAWEELWARIDAAQNDKPALPQIDFTSHTVVVAAMGQAPDHAHSIRIDEVLLVAGGAIITVDKLVPGNSCVALPAITTPLDIYVAPAFSGEPVFEDRELRVPCN